MVEESTSTAVDRALTILEAVSEREVGLTNAEISRKLGIPKSSASYILRVLEGRGYLRRDGETGRYRMGLRILNLSRGVLSGIDLREIALPALRQLMDRSRLTTHLAILDGKEAVYIERVEAPGFVRMNTWIGRRMEIHATAVGKALVAWMPEDELKSMFRDKSLRRHTPKTITVYGKLMQDLASVREKGVALDDEENDFGVRCVAAPVFDQNGKVVASVGVSGTTTQNDYEHLPRVMDQVRDAARRISQNLGWQPPKKH